MAKRANGEGTIYKRKDGRWCASVSLDFGKRKYTYGKTREEVGRKLTVAQKAKQDGLPLPTERQTLAQFLAHWLESVKPSLRPSTHRRYEQLVRLHALPYLGKIALPRVKPDHLQRLYADRLEAGQAPASVRQLHAVLHRAFRQAMQWGLIGRNVVDLVSAPRVPRSDMQALSPEQARTLLDAASGNRLEALYVVALTTGMRQGELLALRWRDVDLDGRSISVRKTLQRTADGHALADPKTSHSRRNVRLAETAVQALQRHRVTQNRERLRMGSAWQDLDFVFADEAGGFIKEWNLRKQSFLPLLQRAGLPTIRFHDLRHSAATLMMGQGVHPKIVSEMLGHSQVSITLDLYSHVTPTMQERATDALDAVLGA